MPKVTINEIDQSRYVVSNTAPAMVVLVPGTASFGPVFSELNPAVTTFSGETGLQNFYKTFGYGPATISKQKPGNSNVYYQAVVDGDMSFEYVTNLLNNGATVQFVRINSGTKAETNTSIPVEFVEGVGSNTADFSARYDGRFGNYLAVQVSNIIETQDGNYEGVIGVYMAKPRLSNAHSATTVVTAENIRKKYTPLEAYRVSSDPTSPYYASFNAFDYIDNIYSAQFVAIAEKMLSDKKDTFIAPLFGGLDFAATETSSSGAEVDRELTDDDDIMAMLLAKLSGKAEDSTVFDISNSVYSNFTDPYLFDFDFVTSGGLVDDNNAKYEAEHPVHTAMINLCEKRGDCVALLDTPKEMKAYFNAFGTEGSADVKPDATVSDYASHINSSYAACYAPWCSVVSASTASIIDMPPSYIFMASILKGMSTSVNSDLWYVPAGVTRAAAPFIISPKYEIGSVILDEFQNNHNYRVNPIMRVRNYGYCVYGNSTCLQSIDGVSRSALESMNVRLISNVIKKTIFAVCSALAFEYNDSRLWAKFYSQMDKVLIYMKRNYGLYDYKIVMDGTTVTSEAMNERRVPGKIMISPTLAGEYFDIDFEISPSGVSFSEEA